MALSKILKLIALPTSLAFSVAAIGEDIDIFSGGADITGNKPNVLIIVDNSANWNSNNQHWPGGVKQGQSELTSLRDVLSILNDNVRVGLMMFVKGAGADDGGDTAHQSTGDGAYVRFAIRDMNDTNRTAIRSILAGIYPNFNDQNTGQQVATSNTDYGAAMHEAYRYFNGGYRSFAGAAPLRDYPNNGSYNIAPYKAGNVTGNALNSSSPSAIYISPISTDAPCAKNYIIFIGNGFPSVSSVDPSTVGDATLVDTTNDPNRWRQIYPEGTKTTYADEWARFLQKYGVSSVTCTTVDGVQSCPTSKYVTTYTIDVYKDQQDLPQTSLLKSMATVGGGKYFAATSESEIKTALTNIFNEIQAVNSVFTSASLPVSVNTQGTYLNQVYMGVFRPDGGGKPRWLGNLKEYKIGLSTDGSLFLADADGKHAVNSQSGFVASGARSYWTACPSGMTFDTTAGKCTGTAVDGFWRFNPQGNSGQYDAPDGDLVEKGGAAQKLRTRGPAARTVYTCTPACTANAVPAFFETANEDLKTAVEASSTTFGAGSTVSLSRVGTTVTGTTAASLGLDPEDIVSISGTTVPDYNAAWQVTRGSGNSFSFTVAETPATPATGTVMTVASGSAVTQTVQTSPATGNATLTNGVVTVTLPSHGLTNNQQVTIAGAALSASMSQSTSTVTVSTTDTTPQTTPGATSTTQSPTVTTADTAHQTTSYPDANTTRVTTPMTDTYTTTTTTGSTVTTWTRTTVTSKFTPCSSYPSVANCEYNGTFNITYIDDDHFSYTPPSSNFGSTVTTTTDTDYSQSTSSGTSTTTTTSTYSKYVDTRSVNVTTYSPPESMTTAGNAVLTCKKGGGSTTYTPSLTSVTRDTTSEPVPATPGTNLTTTATGTKLVTVKMSGSGLTDCNLPLAISNENGGLDSFAIANSTGNAINGTYTVQSSSLANGVLTVTFNVTVTATTKNTTTTTTSYSAKTTTTSSPVTGGGTTTEPTPSTPRVTNTTTTLVPSSPATGTITATATPTRRVTSITRTPGNGSNVATVTVTTAIDHGFSGQSQVSVAGADQTEYNGTKTAANSLAFPTANTITYTLTTGPTVTATGRAAKGYAIDPQTLINWVRGVDNKEDENANTLLTDARASIHGDVLHSRPLVVNYGGTTGVVAFYGSNDGVLRAVKGGTDATDGVEKWAFVAPEHYGKLARLYNNSPLIKFPSTSPSIVPAPIKRDYFFDGNIGIYRSADLATTHIFVAMRRGGANLYAFDVSDPDSPKFLWKKGQADLPQLAETWSEPKVIRLRKTNGVACSGSDPSTYVRGLIFGAGYDSAAEDIANQGSNGVVRSPTVGRGVYILNATDGSLIKLMQPSDVKKYSFAADLSLLDTHGDGCIDRVYAVDTGANIFRLDIGDENPVNWKTYKIAALGDVDNNGGSDDRKFLFPADVVLSGGSNEAYVLVGSGNREDPRSTAVSDMFFVVKDQIPTGTNPAGITTLALSDLTQVTTDMLTGSAASINISDAAIKGWYLPLESGEKSVNAPLTTSGVTYFGTNKPTTATPGQIHSCQPNLGIARGYAINYLSGTAAYDRDGTGSFSRNDLYTTFAGGGLPPSPVSGVVKIADPTDPTKEKAVRFTIGTGGKGVGGSYDSAANGEAGGAGGNTNGGSGTGSNTNECRAAICADDNSINVPSKRVRAFWYFKKDD